MTDHPFTVLHGWANQDGVTLYAGLDAKPGVRAQRTPTGYRLSLEEPYSDKRALNARTVLCVLLVAVAVTACLLWFGATVSVIAFAAAMLGADIYDLRLIMRNTTLRKFHGAEHVVCIGVEAHYMQRRSRRRRSRRHVSLTNVVRVGYAHSRYCGTGDIANRLMFLSLAVVGSIASALVGYPWLATCVLVICVLLLCTIPAHKAPWALNKFLQPSLHRART